MNRRTFSALLSGLALSVASAAAFAQDAYPNKPITMINPFPPGSPVDVVARELAQKLGDYWKQTVIVDNRPGAGGTLGASAAARAKPDGYTVLLTSSSTHAIGPAVRKNLPYDVKNDFTPLAFIGHGPNIVVVNPKVPVSTLDELIALAKEKPGSLTFASSGVGTILHLTGEVFMQRTGTDLMHVPYQGAAPASTDLLGGHVEVMFDSIANATPFVLEDRLKALAVLTPERSPLLPDVPTAVEQGYEGIQVPAWFGLFGPANLPADVVASFEKAITEVLANSPEMKERFQGHGILVDVMVGQEFADKIDSDIATMKDVVAKSGMELLD